MSFRACLGPQKADSFVPRPAYQLPVSVDAEYEVILNSDSRYYWGSDYAVSQTPLLAENGLLTLALPPLSTLYLRRRSEA